LNGFPLGVNQTTHRSFDLLFPLDAYEERVQVGLDLETSIKEEPPVELHDNF
jgi:hypothetical protein